MTGRLLGKKSRSLVLTALAGLVATFTLACGPEFFEIPIETPIQPKMDVSPWLTLFVGLAFTGSRAGLIAACTGAASRGCC